ncbi:MAG: glucose 1-dehydrogenase [Phycisphaera sp.]|nr:glucose 1-dehydrogenase [Phycisphaera sp.]
MIDLTGKHVFVAGGSRGIGRAVCVMAAKAGADVTVNYVRNRAAADDVVNQVTSLGRMAFAVQADISQNGAARDAVDKAVQALGQLDGLVVTAGVFEPAPIDEMTPEFWDRTMRVNVKGTYLAVQSAIPSMRKRGGGSIVIFTSTAGQRGSDIYSAYATSKGAQILFMRSMAKELAPDRIRVNCVAPGWTETDMATDTINALGREDIVKSIPLGRIGLPEDTAAATCYLLSDLANFMTGSTMTVDGGFDMRG